jgi:hypothetical protein
MKIKRKKRKNSTCKWRYRDKECGCQFTISNKLQATANISCRNDVLFSSYITSLLYLADTQNNLTHMFVPAASVLTHSRDNYSSFFKIQPTEQ